jgi:hypothetical protein
MTQYKTVLAPNAPWPEPTGWPKPPAPEFEHKSKPIRVIKKKVKPKPPKAKEVSEAVVRGGKFRHPLKKEKRNEY